MTTPLWSPGTLYQPGDLVRPRTAAAITQDQPTNPSFEIDLTGWSQTTDGGSETFSIVTDRVFDGTKSAYFIGAAGTFQGSDGQMGILTNNNAVAVVPGQTINAKGKATFIGVTGAFASAGVRLYWFDASNVEISYSIGPTINPGKPPRKGPPGTTSGWLNGDWIDITCSGTAPPGAVTAKFAYVATGNGNGSGVWLDLASWDYSFADTDATPEGLVFKAVQVAAGFSGAQEPVWPTANGDTVVDNDVTWEATTASRIVWTAAPILVSGAVEPTFPVDPNSTVADNTISWQAMPWTVDDERAPHSKIVAIATSKVFAGDDDIAAFSATVNPLDWSTEDDAGFLPFGLQTYGAESISAFGLYRGNLLIFNAQGFQMWQVGEDPVDHALLDAVPVGSRYHLAGVPIANDFVFLTDQGIRSIGIAAASTNLQADDFGKAIDSLVKPAVKAAVEAGSDPLGLFIPALGQYWLIVQDQAFVMTSNGTSKDAQSWSRYTFPSDIDNWTILDGDLYLRSGDLVWRLDDDAIYDDQIGESGEEGTTGEDIEGYVAWPYLDFGQPGRTKSLEAFDLVIEGEVDVQFGYDQSDDTRVTPAYTLTDDTLPGEPIPMPLSAPSMQLRLTFAPGQTWSWNMAVLYTSDTTDFAV